VAKPEEGDLFDAVWVLGTALLVGFVPLWVMLTAVLVMAGQVGAEQPAMEVMVGDDGSVVVVEAGEGSWLLAGLEAAALITVLGVVSAVGWGAVTLAQRAAARPRREVEVVTLEEEARVRVAEAPASPPDEIDRLVR
jgi:hypothetical protein